MPTDFQPELQYKRTKKYTRLCREIVLQYPKQLSHIDPEDIEAVINTFASTSDAIARVSIVPPKLQPILGEKIIVEIWECHWDELSEEARLLVLRHELEHVVEYEGNVSYDKKYKTKHHDVQEFGTFIEKFGIHWTRRTDLPHILKEHVKIKRSNKDAAVLG
jgi:predicted metallopeptidase